MIAQVENHPNLSRDMKSKGISNLDLAARERLKKEREFVSRLIEHDKKFDKIEKTLDAILDNLNKLMKKNGANS